MELNEAIRGRRSVRSYEPRPVPRETLVELVEAGCWAPSAGNLQTWKFVILTDEQKLRKLRMIAPGVIGDPTAAIVVCEDVAESTRRAGPAAAAVVTKMDAAAAAFSITLSAHAAGLGSCLVGSFHAKAVQQLVHLPEDIVPMLIVSIGYPAKTPKAPPRKIEGSYFFEVYNG